MNKYTNVLLSIILILVMLNLVLTGSVLFNQATQPNLMNDSVKDLETSIALDWGKKVSEMYNQQDHQALYALFNEQAKVKISHQQLQSQLAKLYQLFGEIEHIAFDSAKNIGKKGDDLYYKLLFDIRVKESSRRSAMLTLSVVKRDNKVSLFGVRINATYPLD